MSADTAEAVLALYCERINNHRFDDLMPLISDDAVFWFGDGSHAGIAAVRAAFEATWGRLADERYWLSDLHWLASGDTAAACCYRFHWQATIAGAPANGQGRGTTVLAREARGWRIVHEHLSGVPS